jgi:hypothetical protein
LQTARANELALKQAAEQYAVAPAASSSSSSSSSSTATGTATTTGTAAAATGTPSSSLALLSATTAIGVGTSLSLRDFVAKGQPLPWLDAQVRREIASMEAIIQGLNADNQKLTRDIARANASLKGGDQRLAAACQVCSPKAGDGVGEKCSQSIMNKHLNRPCMVANHSFRFYIHT